MKAKTNITVHLNAQVTGVEGDKFLSAITIKNENGEQQART